jgi:hypothetical protein
VKLQVTFETGHVARLSGLDGAVAFVWQDERPLGGVAVRADWRLNGFLSRLVADNRFSGERGEWLLVHTQGRLPFSHLFLVGMGRRTDNSVAAARRALQGVAGKVALAGLHSFAADLSEAAPVDMAPEDAMVAFLEALSQAYPDDALSDPPYRPAQEARQRNEERAQAARRRRQELQEARRRWEQEQAAARSAEAADGGSAEDEEAGGGVEAPLAGATRKVAGQIPAEADPNAEPGATAAPPPDPSQVPDPELEPAPERTVRVVLLGEPGTVGAMRQALKNMGQRKDAPIDVEWSR